MTSDFIAQSVGTNASYIRKVCGLLKRRGIIESRQGVSGFTLLVPPEELTLRNVYEAVSESDQVHVFDLHQNPNDECVVGRHIRPVLSEVFRGVEQRAELELSQTTLADCMQKMRTSIDKEQQHEGSDS